LSCRDFFNSVAQKWDTMCQHDVSKIDKILELVDLEQEDSVLDVGTGTGVMIPHLLKRVGLCGHITGIDIAEKMLKIAEAKNTSANVRFIHGDIMTINLNKESFNTIMCYSVFPHLNNQRLAISKMCNLVKPSGKVIICHSQSREKINNLHKKSAIPAISNDYLPSASTVSGYFKEQGMKVLQQIDNTEMFVVLAQKIVAKAREPYLRVPATFDPCRGDL
jgi:ubiquinone/menaquinone biosynthesis C-methylase UbiE